MFDCEVLAIEKNIFTRWTPVEQVSYFTYLGSIICGDEKIDKELTVRV